jgi:hypothetical protein
MSVEIYVQSNFITPSDLSAEVTALGYLGNQSPTSVSYGPGGIGQSSPNFLYFVTGSTAQVYVDMSDETINFTHSGASLLGAATSFMSPSSESFIPQGLYGMQMQAYGSYVLTATGRHDIPYALTDLAGNTSQKSFSVYRLPSITGLALSVTGSMVTTTFVSDIAGPVEISYVQGTATGKMLLSAQAGVNTVTLGAAALTGTITVTVGIEQALSDITLPDTVYNTLQQNTSYVFDTTPDAISFVPKTTITPGMTVDFGPVTLAGFNMPIDAHVTAGSLRVNNITYGTGVTQVHPGDVVTIALTAGSSYSSVYSGQLIL